MPGNIVNNRIYVWIFGGGYGASGGNMGGGGGGYYCNGGDSGGGGGGYGSGYGSGGYSVGSSGICIIQYYAKDE